jgi:hypothetical protein
MSEIERAIEKKEYIERGAALELFWEYSGNWNLINAIPDADVEEVVHGRWIREDETQALLSVMWHCSKCEIPLEMNGIYTPIGAGYKYCPNCGAHMDGKDGE